MKVYLGLDFGTSGARAVAIDDQQQIVATAVVNYNIRDIATWEPALIALITEIPQAIRECIGAIAIDGTSGTVLFCDATGQPLHQPAIYNDSINNLGINHELIMETLQAVAPVGNITLSSTSSLAKLMGLAQKLGWSSYPDQVYFLHQADWLAFLLHGQLGVTDYHNALKLGYDVKNLCYPDWILEHITAKVLPKVVKPGTAIAGLKSELVTKLQINPHCLVCAGTTDSTASFIASGANRVGEAVTSLGSTLVLKVLSQNFVEDSRYGIYSHRIADLWLVGGSSNTGGAVLKQFFTDHELETLSQNIDCDRSSPLDYYPLITKGERFPINDPEMVPILEPRPDDPVEFLHGLLESMARIEAEGYALLEKLGASPITHIYSTGGGAVNSAWAAIRTRNLCLPVSIAKNSQAAYGTALLALRSCSS